MTNPKLCSEEDGRLFAANNGKRVWVGQRLALVCHSGLLPKNWSRWYESL